MQFFRIAAYVQIVQSYGLVHYAACAFCPYINGLRSALVGVAYQAVLYSLGLYGRLRERERESVSVFDGLVCL